MDIRRTNNLLIETWRNLKVNQQFTIMAIVFIAAMAAGILLGNHMGRANVELKYAEHFICIQKQFSLFGPKI